MMMDDADTSAMVDLTTIDKGQFAPLFDAMMGMMDRDMMTSMSDMMMMDDAAMMDAMSTATGTDMSAMTMMMDATVADEDEACTMLRAELTQFFTVLVFTDMQMGMGMMEVLPMIESTGEASMDAEMAISYTAPLSGPQEVPGPGDADSTGSALISINAETNEVCWDITVAGAMLPAAAAHIHAGALGVAGPVVVALTAPDANGAASGCTTADAAVVAAILADPSSHYVNIHTSDFPDGALRGQLVGGM